MLSPTLAVLAYSLLTATPSPAAPRNVYVGIYLHDVTDFDLKGGHFKADLRAWVKWSGDEAPPPIEFENCELTLKEELAREHDGAWHSVMWRVQGTFRGDFPVHHFPFDTQQLALRFSLPRAAGQLVPDLGASSLSPTFSITGWLFEQTFHARTEARQFGSDLGSVSREGEQAQVQSAVFSLTMSRPLRPYLLKFLLPLAMILGMAVLALMLPITSLGERTGMGVTALLSCIAFHFTQSDTLPNVSYLVAADKLFLAAYVLIAASLSFTVLGFNLKDRWPHSARRLDRLGAFGLPLLAVVGVRSLLTPAAVEAAPPPPPLAQLASASDVLRLGTLQPILKTRGTFSGLTRRGLTIRADSGEIVPVLAEQAPTMTNGLVLLLPDGGMRVRWTLRPGLRWSDGAPLTADDLVANVPLLQDAELRQVTRIDDRTVDLEFSTRDVARLHWPSLHPAARVREAGDGGAERASDLALAAGAVASGPLRLVSLDEQRAVFERNPHWAGRPAAVAKFELVLLTAGNAVAQFEAGQVDIVPSPPPALAALLAASKDASRWVQPGENLVYLNPDVSIAPWNDARARAALSRLVDRAALVKALAPLPATVALGLTPGSRVLHDGAPPPTPAQLAELGLTGAPLKLFDAPAAGDGPRPGAVLAEQLRQAGLTVELTDAQDLGRLVNRRAHGGLVLHSRSADQLSRFFNVPVAGGRPDTSRVVPGVFEAALHALWPRVTTSFYAERRAQLVEQAQALWAQQVPVVPLYFTDRVAFGRPTVDGPSYGQADSLYWNVETWRTVAVQDRP